MISKAFICAGLIVSVGTCVSGDTTGTLVADKLTSFGKIAWQESAKPVRPGVPGKQPFWNQHAKRFIYAPAFDFKPVDGAARYRYSIVMEKGGQTFRFEEKIPHSALSPVWSKVPVGNFELTVTALSEDGTTLSETGRRKGYRAAPFNGMYHEPPVMELDRSASLALRNLLNKDYVKYWFEHGKPDPGYRLYQYPSKIHGALVVGAITQARLTSGTEEAVRSEKLARIIADYMLSIRFPAGSTYEYMVPTYHGPWVEKLKKSHMKVENHMVIMGVDAGIAFLDLYDLTGDKKYLDAAKLISDTYRKTQQPNGSWPVFARWDSGETVSEMVTIPTSVINYYDRLTRDYGATGLDASKQKALDYIMENPVKTFDWHGQFEDITPRPPYVNHSREQTCDLAIYLLRNSDNIELAEELIRFSEDQFVIWEQPMPVIPANKKNKGFFSDTWITPSVQEQYVFWNPVGRSAGIMIDTFWEAYRVTGKEIYKAKAKSLANAFPAMQKEHDGDYATFFTPHKQNFWLNSVVYPAKVLMNLQQNLEKDSSGMRGR